jgi:hypothetical protein
MCLCCGSKPFGFTAASLTGRNFVSNSIALAGMYAAAKTIEPVPAAAQDSNADWIIENTKIITLDDKTPRAQAIAIAGDKVVGVGARRDLERLKRRSSAVDLISIPDQVARSLIPRKCLRDLACDPFRGWMRCDVDPNKVSAGQPDDDQAVEQIEANGRNNEQVHGGDVRRVVTQEGAPSLGRRSTSLDHVLRHTGLSDLEAELEHLAMNARRSPQGIFRAHPPDQRAQFRIDLRSASKRAGVQTPVPTEARSMPTHESLGPDDRDGLEDRWKPAIQHDQEQALPIRELDATAYPPLQHDHLMPECRVLCLKSVL